MTNNNIKMIKTDDPTIGLLSRIQGWHLIRGNKVTYTDIVKDLIFQDAKKKQLIKNDGNKKNKKS